MKTFYNKHVQVNDGGLSPIRGRGVSFISYLNRLKDFSNYSSFQLKLKIKNLFLQVILFLFYGF